MSKCGPLYCSVDIESYTVLKMQDAKYVSQKFGVRRARILKTQRLIWIKNNIIWDILWIYPKFDCLPRGLAIAKLHACGPDYSRLSFNVKLFKRTQTTRQNFAI